MLHVSGIFLSLSVEPAASWWHEEIVRYHSHYWFELDYLKTILGVRYNCVNTHDAINLTCTRMELQHMISKIPSGRVRNEILDIQFSLVDD
jgi:hypothetical protein